MNPINYSDITIVKRGSLIRESLLKEIEDIELSDLKDQRAAKRLPCIIFKDFNGKLKVLKQ
jgi:hypothetical protein